MGRLIDAEDFESFLRVLESAGAGDYSTDGIISMLEKTPTIEAEPVRHGEWILDEYGNPHCSVCEHVQDAPTNYCSECGAKMDGGDQSE